MRKQVRHHVQDIRAGDRVRIGGSVTGVPIKRIVDARDSRFAIVELEPGGEFCGAMPCDIVGARP